MVTLAEINKTFYYSEDSPSKLKWKLDKFTGGHRKTHSVVAGSNAGGLNLQGYYEVKHNGKSYKCHRLVYMLVNNTILDKDDQIDHKDGDRSNNSKNNLLKSNAILNSRNKSLRKSSKTGETGVSISTNGRGYLYAKATWQELNGEGCWKTFSFLKYGKDLAIKLAIECRKENMNRLQETGAGYSDRHLGLQ